MIKRTVNQVIAKLIALMMFATQITPAVNAAQLTAEFKSDLVPVTSLEEQAKPVQEVSAKASYEDFMDGSTLSLTTDEGGSAPEAAQIQGNLQEPVIIAEPVEVPHRYLLEDNRTFHHVSSQTGFIKDGNVRTNYKNISMFEISRTVCPEAGNPEACLTSIADIAMRPGQEVVGYYTQTLGNTTTRNVIFGNKTTQTINLTGGTVFHINFENGRGSHPIGNVSDHFKEVRTALTDAALSLEDGESIAGHYVDAQGNTHAVIGKLISRRFKLTNGQSFTQNLEKNTGWQTFQGVTTNYKNVSIEHGVFLPRFPKMLIGTYLVQGENGNADTEVGIYGEKVNRTIKLENGKTIILDLDDVKNTGRTTQGDVTDHYKDIRLFKQTLSQCRDNGEMIECVALMQVEMVLEPGEEVIGTYTVTTEENGWRIGTRISVIGKMTGKTIKLEDGTSLFFDPAQNKVYHNDGNPVKNYKDPRFFTVESSNCPTDPEMGAPCALLVDEAILEEGEEIVGYYRTVEKNGAFQINKKIAVIGKRVSQTYTLQDGKKLTVRLEDYQGWMTEGAVTTHYKNVVIEEGILLHGEGVVLIGQVTLNGTVHNVYGQRVNRTFKMENGQTFVLPDGKTEGTVKDDLITNRYKDVRFQETNRTTCRENGNALECMITHVEDVIELAEGESVIGTYQVKETHDGWVTTKTVHIIGKLASKRIQLENGASFVWNLADNTGQHIEDSVTTFYKNVYALEQGEIAVHGNLLEITTYSHRGVIYTLYGTAVKRKIQLEDGRILTQNLEPVLPLKPTKFPVIYSAQSASMDFLGGTVTSAPVMARSSETEDLKKKKKRLFRPLVK